MDRNEIKPYINEHGERISKSEYDNIKFDKFLVRVNKGKKSIIQEHATLKDESLNKFVNRAIDETMERDTKDGE